MKKYFLLPAAMLFSFSVIAQDTEEFQPEGDLEDVTSEMLIKASTDVIELAVEDCRYWAVNDGLESAELASYLLNCVNEVLLYQGFQPVSSVN
ncbi:MAG: hypothetical protein ACPGF6_05025 [Porticoccaceae bacterium]